MEQPYTKSLSGLCLCLNNVKNGSLLIVEREMQANKALQMQIKLCSCQNPEVMQTSPWAAKGHFVTMLHFAPLFPVKVWTSGHSLTEMCSRGGIWFLNPSSCSSYLSWKDEVTEAVLYFKTVNIHAEVTRLYTQRSAWSGIGTRIQLMILNLAQSVRF